MASPIEPITIKLIELLADTANKQGVKLLFVGGVVRDLLRDAQIITRDLDFLVEGRGDEFAEFVLPLTGGKLEKFTKFFTAKIENPSNFFPIHEIDFVSAREEVYLAPGDLPHVSLSTVEKDLHRRDFTINAMAIEVNSVIEWLNEPSPSSLTLAKRVIDPSSGQEDLASGFIRVLHDKSFLDDPTRIFRACRYAARLPAGIEAHTSNLIRHAIYHGALKTISHFRKLAEVRKIIYEENSEAVFLLLSEFHVWKHFPLFLEASLPKVEKALNRVKSISSDVRYEVMLRVFFHLSDRPTREDWYKELGFGKKTIRKMTEDIEAAFKHSSGEETKVVKYFKEALSE